MRFIKIAIFITTIIFSNSITASNGQKIVNLICLLEVDKTDTRTSYVNKTEEIDLEIMIKIINGEITVSSTGSYSISLFFKDKHPIRIGDSIQIIDLVDSSNDQKYSVGYLKQDIGGKIIYQEGVNISRITGKLEYGKLGDGYSIFARGLCKDQKQKF
jgi:hypothetical protein